MLSLSSTPAAVLATKDVTAMPQRTRFTTVTALPPGIRRAQAVRFLHDHLNMLDLNPLVKSRVRIPCPPHAEPGEEECVWYAVTDTISYLPGGLIQGEVKYSAAFHDLPHGIQTHSYAAMGVHIKGKWTIGGNEPGERPEPRELGLDVPSDGLYIREDTEVKCNMMMTRFIKKTILKSHGKLLLTLQERAGQYADSSSDLTRGRGDLRSIGTGRANAARSCSPSLPSPTEPRQIAPFGQQPGMGGGGYPHVRPFGLHDEGGRWNHQHQGAGSQRNGSVDRTQLFAQDSRHQRPVAELA